MGLKAEYIRVSSEDQDERATYEMQSYFNRKIADQRKEKIDKTYYDNKSGLERNRPGLIEMLSEIEEIEILYVYDQSRLTRSSEDLAYLIRVFEDNQVTLIGTSTPINVETIEGKAITKMIGVWYEMEALKTGKRVKDRYESKLAESKKNGTKLVWGRPEKIKNKDFDRFVKQDKIVNKVDLAKLLKVSPGTLYNYMKKRFGKTLSRKELMEMSLGIEIIDEF